MKPGFESAGEERIEQDHGMRASMFVLCRSASRDGVLG